jgi:hypothetical protein
MRPFIFGLFVLTLTGCGTTIVNSTQVCEQTRQSFFGIPYNITEVCEGTGSSEGETSPPVQTEPQ